MPPERGTDRIAGLRPASRQDAGGPGKIGTAGVPPASADAASGTPAIWRSRGYLPHLDAPNPVQHVVFRLADSLPTELQRSTANLPLQERITAIDTAPDSGLGERELSIPAIASLVQSALLLFDAERYVLTAWCVTPNHVHALMRARSEYGLDRILHSWKSFVRDDGHLANTAAYIEGNPVRAGLCENISDWRFSSAWRAWDARGPEQVR